MTPVFPPPQTKLGTSKIEVFEKDISFLGDGFNLFT